MEKLEVLLKQIDEVFSKRVSLLNLWQTIAEHFYPERADFTFQRTVGEEYGADLMSSYPVLVRRDLGNSLSSILRPTNKEWMHTRIRHRWDKVGIEGRRWLEQTEGIQRRAMYDTRASFVRATKEADHDFSTFGQACLEISLNKDASSLLYRCWHLRDVAWIEDENGKICIVFRRSRPKVYDMARWFPTTIHPTIKEKLAKDPWAEADMIHCILTSDRWELPGNRFKYVSLYIDPTNRVILEEKPSRTMRYVIPRWATVSGSQYAVSPATCVALPDARMLQAMIGVLLEAGEKAVNPPTVANKNVFGGNFAIYAGGTTWADMADGRISDHFSVLPQDKSGIPLGREMAEDIKQTLKEAFFLNKLTLPPPGTDMTAYEVGQRVQEYIRQAMPLFEPMEQEYNGPMCDETFTVLLYSGAFGSLLDIPKELQNADVEFAFESPLHDAVDKAKSQKLLEAKSLVAEVIDSDPGAVYVLDFRTALTDALKASQIPAAWIRSDAEARALADAEEENQKTAELLAQMQQSADVAKTISDTGASQPGGVLTQ